MTEHHFLPPGLEIEIDEFESIPPHPKDYRIRCYFFIDGRGSDVEPFGVYTRFNHKVPMAETSIEPFLQSVRRAVTKRFKELADT